MKSVKKILRVFLMIFLAFVIVIIIGIAALMDLPKTIKIAIHGGCPSKIVDGRRNIDFLGHTLNLPDKLITECYAYTSPDLGGVDPASVTLDAKLPEFTPLRDIEWPNIYKSDDQIRISFSGYEVSDYEVSDKEIRINKSDIEKTLEWHLLKKNREGDRIYSLIDKKVHGLDFYRSDKSIPLYSGDIYISKTESGDVEFYLECFEDKKKHHRYWNCNSNDFSIKPGISYHYYYNIQHLPNARKIHNEIQKMIKITE